MLPVCSLMWISARGIRISVGLLNLSIRANRDRARGEILAWVSLWMKPQTRCSRACIRQAVSWGWKVTTTSQYTAYEYSLPAAAAAANTTTIIGSASRNRKDLLATYPPGRPRCTYFRAAFNRGCICSGANDIAIPSALEVSNKQIPRPSFPEGISQ